MATPAPTESDISKKEDHSHWQVVLSDPSSRKLVLYNPFLRRLAVQDTPPGSPRIGPAASPQPYRKARSSPRRVGPGLSDAPAGARPRERGPPLSAESGASDGSGDNAGGEEDGEETPPATLEARRPGSNRVGTVGPPPSVCPLCMQDLPRRPGSGSAHRERYEGTLDGWLLPPSWETECTDTGATQWSDSIDLTDDYHEAQESDSALSRSGRARTLDGQSYFDLLSEVNSRVTTPSSTGAGAGTARALPQARSSSDIREDTRSETEGRQGRLDEGQMNEGYFKRFFEELQLLGKGGQGSVYLVRHMLNGEALGLYACKKIPVGDSTPSLLSILREVHLLESAAHANITRYHHAWLETSPGRSAFAPAVPTLHVLMEFANGGSLQGFIDARKGAATPVAEEGRRERARRARKEVKERAVHLLRVEDIMTLFRDIVEGLTFLHGRSILHLDLKAENVLLHWEDDALLPTCKLSDFGNATSDSYHAERRGGSGTLLYTPPEAFFPLPHTGHLPPPDRATDMWALGLILYLLSYFALPYVTAEGDDTRAMEDEVKRFGGFHPLAPLPPTASARHDLPPGLLALLQALINRNPTRRPLCERVLGAVEEVRAELKRGWRPRAYEGAGEEMVLAAPRGSWAVGQPIASVPLWRPYRGRSVGRLSSATYGDQPAQVEAQVEEPESRDESGWSYRTRAHHRPSERRRSTSPAISSRSRSSSLPPLPPPERVPLPLPPPPMSSSQAPSTSKPVGGAREDAHAVVGPMRQAMDERVGDASRRSIAVLAAVLKLLLLILGGSYTNHTSSYESPDGKLSVVTSSQVPFSVATALVLETALDVTLADGRYTLGIALLHVALMRWM